MVTVNRAIKTGQLVVNVPVAIIMFCVLGLCIFLVTNKQAPDYLILASILLAPLTGWIYWSFAITRWRIWAFTNVDNVHELKSKAISGKLIWSDGHIFEKTEIRTKRDKEIIKELERRFIRTKERKIIADDNSVPITTEIFYSRKSIIIEGLAYLACLAFGLYLLALADKWLLGSIFTGLGAIFTLKQFVKIPNRQPQLILNEKSIKIKNKQYSWDEITHVTITKSSNTWLTLETNKGIINETIDNFDISIKDLEDRINIYIMRAEKAATTNNT